MLRYVTAGETHGKQLTVILEGVPAGLRLSEGDVNRDLARRQQGYGRGARMKIEKDAVEFLSGVRLGETLGSPIALAVRNRDWDNWKEIMATGRHGLDDKLIERNPRPGHADLAGALKFNRKDLRDILERASARETAARVAAGAVCRKLLQEFDIFVYSFTKEIGGIRAKVGDLSMEAVLPLIDTSEVRTPDAGAGKKMMAHIAAAAAAGDTVGGTFAVVVSGVPAGLGSHTQWDLRLDGNIARALMAVQAVKGVEFGLGFGYGATPGSKAHDEILFSAEKGFFRTTNNAGGIEGGISNGQLIVASCAMKPIPSLKKPLRSVNIKTKKAEPAAAVRSDVCAVPAAGIVGEAVVAVEVARALKEKFGGDSLGEMQRNYRGYLEQMREF